MGRKGLIKCTKFHPDLVVADVMMPELDGIEMTKQIKNDFSISHIPVIMLTAKSTIKDQLDGLNQVQKLIS